MKVPWLKKPKMVEGETPAEGKMEIGTKGPQFAERLERFNKPTKRRTAFSKVRIGGK